MGRDYEHCLELQKKLSDTQGVSMAIVGQFRLQPLACKVCFQGVNMTIVQCRQGSFSCFRLPMQGIFINIVNNRKFYCIKFY